MAILFNLGSKQRNGTDDTQKRTFCNPRINKSEKSSLNVMYVVVISCFHSVLRQKTYVEGTNVLNLLPPLFDIVLKIPQNVAPKIYGRNVSSTSFRLIYTVNG